MASGDMVGGCMGMAKGEAEEAVVRVETAGVTKAGAGEEVYDGAGPEGRKRG